MVLGASEPGRHASCVDVSAEALSGFAIGLPTIYVNVLKQAVAFVEIMAMVKCSAHGDLFLECPVEVLR